MTTTIEDKIKKSLCSEFDRPFVEQLQNLIDLDAQKSNINNTNLKCLVDIYLSIQSEALAFQLKQIKGGK